MVVFIYARTNGIFVTVSELEKGHVGGKTCAVSMVLATDEPSPNSVPFQT